VGRFSLLSVGCCLLVVVIAVVGIVVLVNYSRRNN
jgi:hypothetical protein